MKSKGGRAKKASYSTIVMRIPTPLQGEVLRLMEEFYSSVNIDKPVTGIEVAKDGKPVTGIEILDLPPRIIKKLKANGIFSVEHADRLWKCMYMGRLESQIPGIGDKTVSLVSVALHRYRQSQTITSP